jgi:ferrous iron transport protein B
MALVGMPNTGKSTLFTRLTGVQARVANWPGMTVDLLGEAVEHLAQAEF